MKQRKHFYISITCNIFALMLFLKYIFLSERISMVEVKSMESRHGSRICSCFQVNCFSVANFNYISSFFLDWWPDWVLCCFVHQVSTLRLYHRHSVRASGTFSSAGRKGSSGAIRRRNLEYPCHTLNNNLLKRKHTTTKEISR